MTIKRITFLQELLAFMGLQDRLHLSWISSAEAGKFVEVVNGFTEKIRKLGPNPLLNYDIKPWLEKMNNTDIQFDFSELKTTLPSLETT